jgi:peptidoglycan/xylan/chitin deacetylase (PgdA/CDA1 family)
LTKKTKIGRDRAKKQMSVRSKLRIRSRLRSAVRYVWPPKPKPLILMYHRIADEPIDPWGIAVSPAHFEEHLQILRRTRYPLPLTDFVRDLRTSTLPPNAVALTFDDGYVDNLVAGKPRLTAADVPATVYLATGYIDRLEPFWWDELARLILVGDGPRNFEIVIGDGVKRFDRGADRSAHTIGTLLVAPSKRRRDVMQSIWQTLRQLEDEERRSIMGKLRAIFAGRDESSSLGRAMTGDEVRALVADGLVTIGAHTITHPVLPGLDTATCHREITESKHACEALIGAPITTFAYPFGEFDTVARNVVKAAGFSFACSMRPGPADAKSDFLALPRIYVPNLNGDAFEQTIRLASAVI